MTEPVYIARCLKLSCGALHTDAEWCGVPLCPSCGGPVEQVPMIPVEGALTDEMVERAWAHYSHPDEDEPESAEIEALRVAMLAGGPWTGNAPFTRDEIDALIWATHRGYAALDDGFSHPRDANREILVSARNKLEAMRDD